MPNTECEARREIVSILSGIEMNLGYGPLLPEEIESDRICSGCGNESEGYVTAASGGEAVCCTRCGNLYTSQFPARFTALH